MSGPVMLDVRDLCVDYALGTRRLRAVDGVSLQMNAGSVLGIAGASGSGKSTVALSLLGLLDRRIARLSGSIRLDGQELTTLTEAGWRSVRGGRIGAIFQSPAGTFNPTMTIGQHLEEAIRCHFEQTGAVARTRAIEALERVGMPRAPEVFRSYAFELSGGMCQRAAIALALAPEPALLIADEPTSSLDVIAQVEICKLLESLNTASGLSIIVISHDLGLIGQLAGQVAVMRAGQVVESGAVDQVFRAPQHAYTRQLLGAAIDLGSAARARQEHTT